MRGVLATSYLTPLREGGSLPGLVEADDDGLYVVKFRGAGQGTAALVAEVVVGELARAVGLRVPELVVVTLDPRLAPREPDEEVQELLTVSAGANLGVDFLPGSVGYDGLGWRPPATEAATVVWLDAMTANVDRTWRNPNLLVWHRALWAIDHGAALVFQHSWPHPAAWATRRYPMAEHVLAPVVTDLSVSDWDDLDAGLAGRVTPQLLTSVLQSVPDDWLLSMNAAAAAPEVSAAGWRQRYLDQLLLRVAGPRDWAREPLSGPVRQPLANAADRDARDLRDPTGGRS